MAWLEIVFTVGVASLVGLAGWTFRYVLKMEGDFRALVQNVADIKDSLRQAFDGLGHRVSRLEQRMDRHDVWHDSDQHQH